jgi:hypothetical protein
MEMQMTVPTIVPLTDIDRLREAGIEYPSTVDAWRWLYRCRHERGMAAAFLRSGRRVLVDVPRYIELIRHNSAL